MTITYTSEVADCKGFGCFWKLLFRWRGSIYKLVWRDLIAYTLCYYALSFTYRFALDEFGRRKFEEVALYMQYFTDLIPIAFVLGFYVSIVVQRWWAQYENLPWPDSLSLYITTFIAGNDDKARMMRRTIVRYANLCFALTLIMISPRVKKRFPSLDHLVEAGILTANEKKIFDDTITKTPHPLYWMPLVWAGAIVSRARKEGRIRDDFAVKTIIDEINRLRGLCGTLLGYDWISVPLVYTQVVTLAVYTFFVATLMGRQFLDPSKKYDKQHLDLYFPIFTYLQFFFYMGWLKVAESLVNPFGEDDDDFEVNWLIDRNVQVAYLIVDEMHNEHPELIQDIYWDEVFPQELPYTIAAQEFRMEPPQGSTANIEVSIADQEILPTLDEKDESPNDTYDSLEKMEQGKETPTSTSGREHIKRMSSNLSSILNNLHPKASIRNFLGGSNATVRRQYTRRPSRFAPKNSSNNLRVGRHRQESENQASDYSFSGSEGIDYNPSSSQESLQELSHSKSGRKLGRTISVDEDGPIVINIKRPGKDPYLVIQTDDNNDAPTRTGQQSKPSQVGLRNTGSFSSIQTSIFKDENAMQEVPLLSKENLRTSSPIEIRKVSSKAPQVMVPPNLPSGSLLQRPASKNMLGRSVSTSGPLENIQEIADDVELPRRHFSVSDKPKTRHASLTDRSLPSRPHVRHSSLNERPKGPQLLGLSALRQSDPQKQRLLSSNSEPEEASSAHRQDSLGSSASPDLGGTDTGRASPSELANPEAIPMLDPTGSKQEEQDAKETPTDIKPSSEVYYI